VLTVGYDAESLSNPEISYHGEVTYDYYGRAVPKHAHGSFNFPRHTSSTDEIMAGVLTLFERTVNPSLLVRRINITVNNLIDEKKGRGKEPSEQLDIFTDYELLEKEEAKREKEYSQEKQRQKAVIAIKKRFGKNAIVKGMNLEDGATTIDRNLQIGGHRA